MGHISELIYSHLPGLFSTGILFIVLVDLGQVSSKDTFSVSLNGNKSFIITEVIYTYPFYDEKKV